MSTYRLDTALGSVGDAAQPPAGHVLGDAWGISILGRKGMEWAEEKIVSQYFDEVLADATRGSAWHRARTTLYLCFSLSLEAAVPVSTRP